jgi:type IV pilus assembly protein PilX
MSSRLSVPSRNRQRGAVLFVSLILLLVLTLIGVTAARMQTVEERIAQNDQNSQLALQSGEAVLRHSETQLTTYTFPGSGGQFLLSSEVAAGSVIADQTPTNFTPSAITYDGPSLTGAPAGVAVYAVESLPAAAGPSLPNSVGGGYGAGGAGLALGGISVRTTALATGADSTSYVKVQSVAH